MPKDNKKASVTVTRFQVWYTCCKSLT